MVNELITRQEIASYKRQVLEQSVLVNLQEAATILSTSPRTVLRRAEEGRLTVYNDNHDRKGVRFLAADLQRYVREMRQTRHLVE